MLKLDLSQGDRILEIIKVLSELCKNYVKLIDFFLDLKLKFQRSKLIKFSLL